MCISRDAYATKNYEKQNFSSHVAQASLLVLIMHQPARFIAIVQIAIVR